MTLRAHKVATAFHLPQEITAHLPFLHQVIVLHEVRDRSIEITDRETIRAGILTEEILAAIAADHPVAADHIAHHIEWSKLHIPM